MRAEGYISHSLEPINTPLFIIVGIALNADCSLARKISMTPVPLMLGWKTLHTTRLKNRDVKKNAQQQRALRIIINVASTLKEEFDPFCCIEASDVSFVHERTSEQFSSIIDKGSCVRTKESFIGSSCGTKRRVDIRLHVG